MILCSNCKVEIKYPKYFVSQLGYLCPDCSKEHGREKIKKLQCEINKLQKQISNINQKVRENIQANCEHEYGDTGYGRSDN